MFELNIKDYIRFLRKAAKVIEENKEYITALDSETGDGDHWLNMNIGYQKLVEKTKGWGKCGYQEMFMNIAMTMMSAMGGSSGVLYGSAYLASAPLLKDKDQIDGNLLADILQKWADAISSRGGAQPGYKTMLDAVYPAAQAYKKALEEGKSDEKCLQCMVEAAKAGAENTKGMEAVKGRASYRRDKSVGYLDPGAVTMALQLECLAECCLAKC